MKSITGINVIFHSICSGGGMERYVIDIMTEFARKDIQVRGIARKAQWPGLKPAQIELVTIKDKTPISRLNSLIFERIAYKQCNPSWPTIGISRTPNGADIAIVGGTHIGHLKDKNKKYIGILNRAIINHEKKLYATSHVIIAHSQKVQEEITRLYSIQNDKITCLYPPIDIKKFNLESLELREKTRSEIGIPHDKFMLFFPSNNHALKGADLILDAIEGLQEKVILVVAGKAPLHDKKVINLGVRTDMPRLYAAADATILASKYEAFGLVAPESILCGTPVILTKNIGAAEVLSSPGAITCERSSQAINDAISNLLNKPQPLQKLSTPNKYINYPFTIEDHVERLLCAILQNHKK
ncbi:glycosyltransferase family 4 protein [Laribacter hongkongensis]|uniref:Glycosyltransferase, group 1 family protein n=1 Tax=Laribacter hongkongensis TaxID=168471 RepID=A0A248LMG8_9NEIS|nr:glycosyltransferase family 4 protein [Laribacter hongkongensis]ASJ25957.1 glycosyltransferase, group 1 family protein [Laribacter hongkongensis]MCG9040020.1 glycosyltransferase family 4 protein [Laribacter hongkongensis]MCG9068305.1 glycosyltransferase family 4 protein [Laribacter hongkongensis]MCG9109644.1 glycosyltransferase family 4 protein [Laribacter hongkongensis]MCG9121426.1 glycosyltransferase family 4 protein [Laribacter hongkongensis]